MATASIKYESESRRSHRRTAATNERTTKLERGVVPNIEKSGPGLIKKYAERPKASIHDMFSGNRSGMYGISVRNSLGVGKPDNTAAPETPIIAAANNLGSRIRKRPTASTATQIKPVAIMPGIARVATSS